MATNRDRQEVDFLDTSTSTVPGAKEVPRDLTESPTVNQPEAEVSPAAAARAALPQMPRPGPDSGGREPNIGHPVPVQNPTGEAVMTRRPADADPGAPLGQSLGHAVADNPGAAEGLAGQDPTGMRTPGAMDPDLTAHGMGLPDHSGTQASLNETTGTDDDLARGRS